MDIQKIIQKEIKTCGKTRYRISIETGIPESGLFKVYHNTAGISIKTAAVLLDYFGYEITKRKERK